MYGDVYVNLACNSSISLKPNIGLLELPDFSHATHEWSLYVKTTDMIVNVTGVSHLSAPKEIVASCLLAGLKNIADHWIYEAACSNIESQLGFPVDRWISPKISRIDKSEFHVGTEIHFVEIVPIIFQQLMGKPNLVLYNMDDIGIVKMVMEVYVSGNKVRTETDFSQEVWANANEECIDLGQKKLLQNLYEAYPELSHLWTQLRYNMFDMGSSKSSIKSTNWTKGNSEDSRVKQLPALQEMVKNPVSGKTSTLKDVIISLNDNARWTREKIADWLETLDIDISFKVDNNEQD